MGRLLTSMAMVLATAASATAQTATEYLLLQRTAARHGEVSIVVDDGTGAVRGRLISATDAVLELETGTGRRRFTLANVMRVERTSDSVINGVIKGVAVATTWCALTCQKDATGSPGGAAFAPRLALGGIIGGAIDRAISRSATIYRRGAAGGISVGVGRTGVGVTVLF